MPILFNVTGDQDAELPNGKRLKPGSYYYHEENVLPPVLTRQIVDRTLIRLDMGYHNRPEDWWLEPEYIAFLKGAHMPLGMLRSNRSVDVVRELTRYINEKLPHKCAPIVMAGDTVGLLCISYLAKRLWRDVILPELQRVATENNVYMVHTFNRDGQDNPVRIDVKVCFLWNQEVGGFHEVRWWAPSKYKNWPSFLRMLQERQAELVASRGAYYNPPLIAAGGR